MPEEGAFTQQVVPPYQLPLLCLLAYRSDDVRDLISRILVADPEKRPTIQVMRAQVCTAAGAEVAARADAC